MLIFLAIDNAKRALSKEVRIDDAWAQERSLPVAEPVTFSPKGEGEFFACRHGPFFWRTGTFGMEETEETTARAAPQAALSCPCSGKSRRPSPPALPEYAVPVSQSPGPRLLLPREPRLKRHKGAGKDPKRKQPETSAGDSGRGGWDQDEAEEWQQVSRRDTEPFELRAQDWDAPIVPHTAVGKKLDELATDAALEAVVMAPKAELEKVATILRGTSKPHRVMLIELSKDGPTRIPGRVGNMLRFRQAKTIQIQSAGKAAAGYAGHKATAVKVAPVETCVVSLRIPEAYLSADKWKGFRTNPTRAIAKWAASQNGGVARPLRQTIVREGTDEPPSAYHERGLRMSPLLGLVAQGGRIGARTTRDPAQAIARIWNFPHVPGDWGPEEVKAVLAQAFDSVTLIHNRRTGREFLYRFRGTHKFGDKDVVPLQATVDDGTATPGEMTLWAQVAPHRPQGNKQHFLKPAPVPLLPTTASPLDGKLVKAHQPAVLDDKGKETSPAQNRALNQREVLDGH
ncbi:hypothetical protein AK812_SmicGene19839 [Symbiodinium microadriaticum]|uniref:Uncharacterized protein n=1 Tax=Symbiodinium microadriaticum TaxID=2951 RepID=A0A1Q9DRK9_SYMMI|nr:hypothetical protein AK812_SmicGene19839 [Symbiodinium microadriaticum]